MEMPEFIYEKINEQIVYGIKIRWTQRQQGMKKLLLDLQPKTPEDGSVGIAFNDLSKLKGERIPICGDLGCTVCYTTSPQPRIKTSVGRFLTRKLNLNEDFLNDKQISDISQEIIKYFFDREYTIRIDKGKQITENYRINIGGRSCMTGDMSRCVKLYEMNPEVFSQLVVIFGDESARAILTKTDCGKTYCDRVYCNARHVHDKLREYAKEQGWYDVDDSELIASNLNWKEGGVPYADTFRMYRFTKDKKLTIFQSNQGTSHLGYLDSCEGYIDENGNHCEFCDGHYNEDDTYYITDVGYVCNICYDEHFVKCTNCGHDTHTDDVIVVENESVCESCCGRLASECNECGNIFYEVNLENGYCSDCHSELYEDCSECGISTLCEELDNGICDDCVVEVEVI